MRIKFNKKAKASWSDEDVVLLKGAARWAASQLKLSNLGIDIIVRLVGKHPVEFGSCSMMDEYRYIVWLHSGVPIKRTLSTLFHELTHIQQHCYSGLELVTHKKVVWKKETYEDFDYWSSPWEKEARKKEYALMKRFEKWK